MASLSVGRQRKWTSIGESSFSNDEMSLARPYIVLSGARPRWVQYTGTIRACFFLPLYSFHHNSYRYVPNRRYQRHHNPCRYVPSRRYHRGALAQQCRKSPAESFQRHRRILYEAVHAWQQRLLSLSLPSLCPPGLLVPPEPSWRLPRSVELTLNQASGNSDMAVTAFRCAVKTTWREAA